MLKGFKDFIMRGNIIDLAVAVVIGTAFAALVTTIVESLINPLLARLGGADVAEGWGFQLGAAGNEATFINLGAIIGAIITFLLTALVVYFVIVVPMNKIIERRRAGQEPEAEEVTPEVAALREIRDLLQARPGGTV